MGKWFVNALVEVEFGNDTISKWIVCRCHQPEPLGDVVKTMIPPLSPDTLVNVCVQAYETEGRLLRSRMMGATNTTPAGPSAGFAVLVSDLNDLNEFRIQVSQGVE